MNNKEYWNTQFKSYVIDQLSTIQQIDIQKLFFNLLEKWFLQDSINLSLFRKMNIEPDKEKNKQNEIEYLEYEINCEISRLKNQFGY